VNYEISSAPTARKAASSAFRQRWLRAGKKSSGQFLPLFCCWLLLLLLGFERAVFHISPSKLQVHVGEGVKETCSPRAHLPARLLNRNKKLFTLGNHNKSPTMRADDESCPWKFVCVKVNRGSCAPRKNTLCLSEYEFTRVSRMEISQEAINLGALAFSVRKA
jgi:hypothetical protein